MVNCDGKQNKNLPSPTKNPGSWNHTISICNILPQYEVLKHVTTGVECDPDLAAVFQHAITSPKSWMMPYPLVN